MTGPAISITLDDVLLRQATPADLPALHALTQPEAMRAFFSGGAPSEADSMARLLRTAGSWALYGYGTFMVIDRASGALIGNCGVFHSHRGVGADFDDGPEAGWIIATSHAGRGLASRVMDAALAWFDRAHGPRRITCMITKGHGASERIAEHLGFVPFRETLLPGDDRPLILYERLPAAIAASPAR
jgi:RimJ/RimL family protein N-acetyltransferase